MAARAETSELRRHLPHALIATFAVSVLPLILVSLEPLNGLPGSLTLALSVALSIAASWFGTVLWVKKLGSGDLVFGDLMLWGWIRRLVTERRLTSITGRLSIDAQDGTGHAITPEEQTKILKQLATSLEARDPYTHGHSRRVTRHSYMIAKALGLPKEEIETIRIAASLHDVGKLNIPLAVIRKPGKLSDEEFAVIKQHAAIGANMVASIGNSELTAIVRHHHERVDGTGYPDRLAGDAIPLGAKIIAVADTFDAITSTRSYRRAAKHARAIGILKLEAGSQLDRKVVETFLGYYSGRNAIEWWAIVTTLPQRLWVTVSSWFRSVGAPVLLQGAAAVGTVAFLGGVVAPSWSAGELPMLDQARAAIGGYLSGESSSSVASSDQTTGSPGSPSLPGDTGITGTGITAALPGSPPITTSPEGDPIVDEAAPDPASGTAPGDGSVTAGPAPADTSNGSPTDAGTGTGEVAGGSGSDDTRSGSNDTKNSDGSTSDALDPVTDAVAPVTDAVEPVTDTLDETTGSTTDEVTDGVGSVTEPVTDSIDNTTGTLTDGPLI